MFRTAFKLYNIRLWYPSWCIGDVYKLRFDLSRYRCIPKYNSTRISNRGNRSNEFWGELDGGWRVIKEYSVRSDKQSYPSEVETILFCLQEERRLHLGFDSDQLSGYSFWHGSRE